MNLRSAQRANVYHNILKLRAETNFHVLSAFAVYKMLATPTVTSSLVVNRSNMLLRLASLLVFAALVVRLEGACDTSLQILQDLTFQLGGSSLEWPCKSTRNIYVQSGRYIPRNVIMTRSQIYRDEAYVTLPRLKAGVPFTLGKISMKRGQCTTSVAPYPCWSLQEEGNCQAIQSAVDIFLDPNDILWVLDVGIVNTLEQPVRRCPPKVLGINVKTGRVVKSIDLSSLVVSSSRLQHIVAEYDDNGHCFM